MSIQDLPFKQQKDFFQQQQRAWQNQIPALEPNSYSTMCANQNQFQAETISEYFQSYTQILAKYPIKSVSQYLEKLKKQNILYYPSNNQKKFQYQKQHIQQLQQKGGYKIINLSVILERFKVNLQICNMNYKKQLIGQQKSLLFQGSFGSVYIWKYKEKKYATKKFYFKKVNNKDFRSIIANVIFQYSFNKLFSALEIGPKVQKIRGFDIIIYKDCIEFDMQCCVDFKIYRKQQQNQQIMEKNISYLYQSLKFMHSLKIIHHDIKPANIMYSRSSKKLIFIDFGFTKVSSCQIGQKQNTLFVGTYNYVTQQMKKTIKNSSTLVDLFWNDLYGLITSLTTIFQTAKNKLGQFQIHQEESLQLFLEFQQVKQRMELFRIVDILRCGQINQELQYLIDKVGKDVIQKHYQFLLDFFIILQPNKQIGFFCQKYLKNVLQNQLNYKQKINKLYEKGWPKALYLPNYIQNPQFQKRFQFYDQFIKNSYQFNGHRNFKIFKRNLQQKKGNLIKYSHQQNQLSLKDKLKILKDMIGYFMEENDLNMREQIAQSILNNIKLHRDSESINQASITVILIQKLLKQILLLMKLNQQHSNLTLVQEQDQKQNNNAFYCDYNNVLYSYCQYLLEEEYYKLCFQYVTIIGRNESIKNPQNIMRIYLITAQCCHKLYKPRQYIYNMNQWQRKLNLFYSSDQYQNLQEKTGQTGQNYEIQQKQFQNTRFSTISLSNLNDKRNYWALQFKKSLAYNFLTQQNLLNASILIAQCDQLLINYQNKPFYNKIYGHLLYLKACAKLNQNLVQQALKYALESNKYYSCAKKGNKMLAVYISNIYCIIGDSRQAKRYFKVANSKFQYQKDDTMCILQGQIHLLEFNTQQAQQVFDRMILKLKNLTQQMRLRMYISFSCQFKGTQDHFFLFKYLLMAEQCLKTINKKQYIFYFQYFVEIVQNKLKFYNFLKQKQIKIHQQILQQCDNLLNQVQHYSTKISVESQAYNTAQRYLFCRTKIFQQKHCYKESIQILKTLLQKIHQNQENKDFTKSSSSTFKLKQTIECCSLLIENMKKLNIKNDQAQMKNYLQIGMLYHCQFRNLIYCLNSNSFAFNVINYTISIKNFKKTLEIIILISSFVTKYKSKRYSFIFHQLCISISEKLQEKQLNYFIDYFMQKQNQKILMQSSQISILIVMLYKKVKQRKYKRSCIKIILNNIVYLGINSREIVLKVYYQGCLKDLKIQKQRTQEFKLLRDSIYLQNDSHIDSNLKSKISLRKQILMQKRYAIIQSNQASMHHLSQFIFKKKFKKQQNLIFFNLIQKKLFRTMRINLLN